MFTDVAARGRALGMHLVLGTQRAAGVVRDSLLANCPLRISLRVTDPARQPRASSAPTTRRALPGGAEGRGIALVRARGRRRRRVACASRCLVAADVDGDRRGATGPASAPALAARICRARIDLADLAALARRRRRRSLLGLADEPDRQRQRPVGVRVARSRAARGRAAPGSGKSTALRTIAAQAPAAWSSGAVRRRRRRGMPSPTSSNAPPAPGTRRRHRRSRRARRARCPHDYAPRARRAPRAARPRRGRRGSSSSRPRSGSTGAVARLADLLPAPRSCWPTASRAEHIAAGGDPAHYAPDAPAGRGRLDGAPSRSRPCRARRSPAPAAGRRRGRPHGAAHRIRRRGARPLARAALAAWAERGIRVVPLDEYAATAEIGADGAGRRGRRAGRLAAPLARARRDARRSRPRRRRVVRVPSCGC